MDLLQLWTLIYADTTSCIQCLYIPLVHSCILDICKSINIKVGWPEFDLIKINSVRIYHYNEKMG